MTPSRGFESHPVRGVREQRAESREQANERSFITQAFRVVAARCFCSRTFLSPLPAPRSLLSHLQRCHMPKTAHFHRSLFEFLTELRSNNNREWFLANKARYEADVRDPLLSFIADFGPKLRKISPHFRADPRPVGGSLFRIYRDTRFSPDKTPYKAAAAAQFRHAAGKDVHAPGFYLHLEPNNVFAGVGLWHPTGDALTNVRDAIVEQPQSWKKAVGGKSFRAHFEIGGDALQRPPRGYDPAHPLIEDIKRKDFVAFTHFSEAAACRPAFLGRFATAMQAAKPFMRFLTKAVDLPF